MPTSPTLVSGAPSIIPVGTADAANANDLPQSAWPAMLRIATTDLVGPQATNRQHQSLQRRTITLANTVNAAQACVRVMAGVDIPTGSPAKYAWEAHQTTDVPLDITGGVGGISDTREHYLSRDGATVMWGRLNLGSTRTLLYQTAFDGSGYHWFQGPGSADTGASDFDLIMAVRRYGVGDYDLYVKNGGIVKKVLTVDDLTPLSHTHPVTQITATASDVGLVATAVDAGAGVYRAEWRPGSIGSGPGPGVAVGAIAPYPTAAIPEGWLECNGQAVSRSSYAELFQKIGTTYGAGDGSTTFNVPDLRGRVIVGAGQGPGLSNRPLASTGGEENHTLSIGEMPSHSHTIDGYRNGDYQEPNDVDTLTPGPYAYVPYQTASQGSNLPHNNMQPYRALVYCICYNVGGGTLRMPAGQIAAFANSTPPAGWVKCDGSALSRTSFPRLFGAIGTTYGAGDGSTTFNVPDLRGEFIRGWDDGRGVDAGRAIGTAQGDQIRSHAHTVVAAPGYHQSGAAENSTGGGDNQIQATTIGTSAFGGNETRPRNVAVSYFISIGGIADNPMVVPTGTVIDWLGASAPFGWLECNGQEVSRATYTDLYAVIGTTFGVGNGATTFNLPNMARRTTIGAGGAGTAVIGNTVGAVGGEEYHTLSVGEMPNHNHSVIGVNGGSSPGVGSGDFDNGYIEASGYTGGDQPHNNMQPSMVVRKLIKW